MAITFPCLVGHRIVELTAEQRDSVEWRQMPDSEKIAMLFKRVEELEAKMKTLIYQQPIS